MFGMLDYRAHKAFILMFGLPLMAYRLAVVAAIPIGVYVISFGFVTGFLYVSLTIVALIICAELLVAALGWVVNKAIFFLFELFIDVIPHDGRSQEEAKLVVLSGEKAIAHIQLNKWIDDDFPWWEETLFEGDEFDAGSKAVSTLLFSQRVLFGDKVRNRLNLYGQYRVQTVDEFPLSLNKFIIDRSLQPKWQEQFSPYLVNGVIYLSLLFVLLATNPLSL
mgnify:CR=1 FL=1